MPSIDELKKNLLAFAKTDLHNILDWWNTHAPDNDNGGFYGAVSGENVPDKEAERFLVLFARILWTYSAAYAYTKDNTHKKMAERACAYLHEYFHDKAHGGFYTYISPKGEAVNDRKFTYGNAFAVYALAEYARAFNCVEAAQTARQTANLLDKHMWDTTHLGYFEIASRDWQYLPHVTMLGNGIETQKTMNTHLHILEAYATLLRINDTPLLRHRIRSLLYLFTEKIINRVTRHFNLYQARDWALTDGAYSLGHDIEGSWLLLEAAEILNEPEVITDVRHACILLARAVYDIGRAPHGGIYTEYDVHKGEYTAEFSWWEQSEGVVGFLNAYEMTGEEKFLQAAAQTLAFIRDNFIDHRYGGWYIYPPLNGKPFEYKASPYHCPYHNTRMSLEVIRRLTDFKIEN